MTCLILNQPESQAGKVLGFDVLFGAGRALELKLADSIVGRAYAKLYYSQWNPVIWGRKIPMGITEAQFAQATTLLESQAKNIGGTAFVQGSRAAGTVTASSDIDFAIRVSSERFNALIKESFMVFDLEQQHFVLCNTQSKQGKFKEARLGSGL